MYNVSRAYSATVKSVSNSVRLVHSGKKGMRSLQMNIERIRSSDLSVCLREAFQTRSELKKAEKIVVKLGSAVITREDGGGVALGRLASIVEQISQLQHEGREMLLVSSGSVAFGRQRLNTELKMSMSMRETLSKNPIKPTQALQAAAAVGQSSLMALYDSMFSQFGVNIAQVLVTKPDFYNPASRITLRSTFSELLSLNIVPIVNTNDAVFSPSVRDTDAAQGQISAPGILINDNDALAAHLAAEVNADLLILMSDVDGVYDLPPGQDGSKLLKTFAPKHHASITFGSGNKVGTGGMESKVQSAIWALERGVSVIICNGEEEKAITKCVSGKQIGTFFTNTFSENVAVETLAANGECFLCPSPSRHASL